MRLTNLSILSVAATFAFSAVGQTTTNCTDWMDQGNGTSWTICVGDDGVQHCYLINNTPGSVAYEVVCS